MAEKLIGILKAEGVLKGSISAEGVLVGRLTTSLPDGGYERGYADGYDTGNAEGYSKGHSTGVDEGYSEGYDAGVSDGQLSLSAVLAGEGPETLDDDNVTHLKQYALANDTTLKVVKLKNMKTGGTSCFGTASALETVDLPSLTRVPYTAFMSCKSLRNVNVPIATLDYAPFHGCSALEKLELGVNADYINAQSFTGCTRLVTLIIRCIKRVAQLNNTNAFSGTPIAAGTGYIYVPAALVEQYKSATNWSTYASQIRAIEDYPEITGGASA